MEITDAWGNLRTNPVKLIEEVHDGNFIRVQIFENNGSFLYGYQLKLGGVIKQKMANVNDLSFKNIDDARLSACSEIKEIGTANRSIRKLFIDFIKVQCNQPELFEEDIYEQCSTNGH
ncbi:MAG: hypothetical protein LBN11_01610 [Tannerella sp.]|jgi:hypothetical protein|nr:hypothetical protein [Tannerella sp.]